MGRIPLLVHMFTIALVAGALAPPVASAWMPEPVQASRAVPLPDGGGARAAGAPVTTTVRTKRRFDLVGVEWRGARSLDVELRVRRGSGRWSRWAHAGATDGADPGESRGARTHGQPVWTGGSDRFQLRLSRRVRSLRLRLVNTTGSATPAARERTRSVVARRGAFGARTTPAARKLPATSAGKPRIVSRKAWGASKCKPRDTPSYGDVRVAYVHHTESVNNYSRSRAASVVLGICLFHRNGNGWDDIGYNFLVDRYGTVYEGRAGGVDAPVIGAQAGGFNSESTGISVIGGFTSSPPPKAATSALARVLAWKLALHGVRATGRTRVTSAGGPSTGYSAGTKVSVNRISGHRDVDLTACPGNAFYRRLPSLRRSVATRQGGVSRLSISPRVAMARYGSAASFSGRLRVPSGGNPQGATIELRQLTSKGSRRVLATTTTAPDGTWSAQVPSVKSNAMVRAVFLGDEERPGVLSRPAQIFLLPRIGLKVSPSPVALGETVTASGTVKPRKRRVTVYAHMLRPDGSRVRMARRTVAVRSGRYSAKLTLKRAGRYQIHVRAAADGRSGAGRSRTADVSVTAAG